MQPYIFHSNRNEGVVQVNIGLMLMLRHLSLMCIHQLQLCHRHLGLQLLMASQKSLLINQVSIKWELLHKRKVGIIDQCN